jgi:hypothetical protein
MKQDNIEEDNPEIEIAKLSRSKYNKDYSMMNSLHYVLQQHKIIPKSLGVEDFYKDNKIKMIKDNELNKTKIKSFTKGLKIEHVLENGKTYNVIDGLNIDLLDNKKLTRYIDNKKDKTILLVQESGSYKPVFIQNKDGQKQSLCKLNDSIFDMF